MAGLAIGSAVGRIALAFLVAANVAYLLAPLIYLTNAVAQPTKGLDLGDPAAVIVVLLTGGQWFMAVGDLLVVVGAGLLSATLASLLLGLRSRGKAAPIDAFFPGLAALACLVVWAIAAGISFGRPRGSGLNAAAATGGQSVAAALVLVASLLYLTFAIRVRTWSGKKSITPYAWPVYAGVNAAGSVAIAAFFVGASRDPELLVLGLALQVVLVPLFGVWAYKAMWDGIGDWRQVGPRKVRPVLMTDAELEELLAVEAEPLAAEPEIFVVELEPPLPEEELEEVPPPPPE